MPRQAPLHSSHLRVFAFSLMQASTPESVLYREKTLHLIDQRAQQDACALSDCHEKLQLLQQLLWLSCWRSASTKIHTNKTHAVALISQALSATSVHISDQLTHSKFQGRERWTKKVASHAEVFSVWLHLVS